MKGKKINEAKFWRIKQAIERDKSSFRQLGSKQIGFVFGVSQFVIQKVTKCKDFEEYQKK